MRGSHLARLVAVVGLCGLGGCGVKAIEGHYAGTVTGTVSVLAIPFPVDGNLAFDLVPAAQNDVLDASGNLTVTKMADGSTVYQATLGGQYALGKLNLTFTATDGKSSGTITANHFGSCWTNTAWTITGAATSGSGTFAACLQSNATAQGTN